MQNIHLTLSQHLPHQIKEINQIHYQPASNHILVLHCPHLTIFQYEPKNHQITKSHSYGPIEELTQNVIMIQDMVEMESVLVITEEGSVFTIDRKGEVDIKAQNQDGITSGSVSPTQEYIYLVTKNKTLVQLNSQFDLVSQIPIDEGEEVVDSTAMFSWRADGSFFILNYETKKGQKAVTKDIMMTTFISPSKSDPEEDGFVQSVSEKGRKPMGRFVAWQPNASIVAGTDYIIEAGEKIYRVIFWEKNGLRHLQFNLSTDVTNVSQLFWSADSSTLYVKIEKKSGESELLAYFRSNYHWFLKTVLPVSSSSICCPLSGQNRKNQLLISFEKNFELIELELRLPEKSWNLVEAPFEFIYFVDGPLINITDLSKAMIPPPMGMFKAEFEADVIAVAKKTYNLLIFTQKEVMLYDCCKRSVVDRCGLDILKGQRVANVKLLQNDNIAFISAGKKYKKVENKLECQGPFQQQSHKYVCSSTDNEQIVLETDYQNQDLSINNNLVTQECSSFIFYQQFLLFTVSTSQMYDKLYVINLSLSSWIHQDVKIKHKLAQFQTKQMLNHRLVERGARIVGITNGKVIFQLPRGNLEGIYPKLIMLAQVQFHIKQKQYLKAFETVRTHKLDFNLLHDINPQQFNGNIETILTSIKRVDYINLLIAQTTETLSSQLQYIMTKKEYDSCVSYFELNLKGKKIRNMCRNIATALRNINKEQFIMSIFTAQIKEGKINDVLFEIKEMKKDQVQVVVPPHLVDGKNSKKKVNSQQVLEYVCWLVDANAIYDASLLTYDLELAAMTARCTQKDPKEYIPYFESLKEIKDEVDFKTKICLDLKQYSTAIKELSQGSQQQKEQSLDLIKKHKLFKDGLVIYSGKNELLAVKEFIIEEFLMMGEVNEAYRICQSSLNFKRCLEIAINATDAKKIKQSLKNLHPGNLPEQKKQALQIIEQIKEDVKNKSDLAKLYTFTGQYEEAMSLYIKNSEYSKVLKYLPKVTSEFINKQIIDGFKLSYSIKRNEVLKDKKQYVEKYTRLVQIHKDKEENGITSTFKARQNDDMYSEASVTSKAASSYTMSTTTGMRKKKEKKRSVLSRNVKEGSPIEEQYLLAYMKMLEEKVEDALKDSKLLIQHLIYMNLVVQAESMRNEVRQYLEVFITHSPKSFAKKKFEESHPQACELYFQESRLFSLKIDNFNYLF